ncbi:MAG: SDR family oxidoreductase [Deltaproteobacteria bacterium]|nr:SDR family oxidoreductase [Deltaproteobacteria bacterium]
MKILFIGGTGNISSAVSQMAIAKGIDLTLLNRGQRPSIPGARTLSCDITNELAVADALCDKTFDCVVNWIAFTQSDVARDMRLFAGRTGQYIFISSASAYQKPPTSPFVTESTPLRNPHWEYSRNKIACEEMLMQAYRESGFPVVIVRPSLTYNTLFPIALGGWGCFTLAQRICDGQEIVVHGDGSSLWTVTHADDFAKGFIPLMGNSTATGHSFHITSDELLTWNQIYSTIADALHCEAKIVHVPSDFIVSIYPELEGTLLGDKSHSAIFDNSKIKAFVPGFVATIPFREGVRRTVDWFNKNPARKTIHQRENDILDTIIASFRKAG